MVSCCNRRLYKGNSYEICLPLADSGVTLVRFYTKGDVIIEKEPEISGDSMCFSFTAEELASLEDGVLRYEIVTDQETKDTNSHYVVVTPGDYSGSTLDDLLEDAFDSGYTAGQEDCSGSSCNLQSNKTVRLSEIPLIYSEDAGYYSISGNNFYVYPKEGKDGMERVQIFGNFRPDEAISHGYNIGYSNGYSQGTVDARGRMHSLGIGINDLTFQEYPETPSVPYKCYLFGSFSDSSGYSSVSANIEVTDLYSSAYTSGKTDGYESGYTAGQEDCSGSSCNLQPRKVVDLSELTWSYKPKAPWVAPQYTISGGPLFVSADSGYDGLIEVVIGNKVYADEAYDDGYGKGFTSGYTAGQEACSGGSCEGIWEDGYDSGYTDGSESVDCTPYYESGVTDGYQSGYTSGHTDGFNDGYDSGNTDGFESGYDSGYTDGQASVDCTDYYNSGVTDGFGSGYTSGYTVGYEAGQADCSGYTQEDLDAAFASGWSAGYQSGYTDGSESGHTPTPPTSGSDALALYLVTSTTDSTKVVGGTTGIGEVKLPDNTPVTLVGKNYTFDQTGIQGLNFTLTGVSYYDDPTTPQEYDEKIYRSIMRYQFEEVGQLVSIAIPEGIELIDVDAFNSCSLLSSVTLPSSLEIISSNAFKSTGLAEITIPENVAFIYGWAFIYCHNLTGMTFQGTTPPILGGSYALGLYDETFPIYVPASAVSAYQNEPSWAQYASRIQAIQ